MRYNETRSIEIFQHMFDNLFRLQIQVVRWFIHNNDVRLRKEHFRERNFGTLTSGERFDILVDFFVRNEKSTEHGSDLVLFGMMFPEFGKYAQLAVQVREYL